MIKTSFSSMEKGVLAAALIYLLVPNLLFLGGWFQPWAACTCGLLLLYSITHACLTIFRQETTSKLNFRQYSFLFLLLVFAALSQFWVGYTGHFAQFSLDFANRNASYGNLCSMDWPLVLPDGRYICFYLAQYLPAAFASKIIPQADSMSLLMLWNILGMALACALLAFHFRLHVLKTSFLLLLLLVLNDPVLLLKPIQSLLAGWIGVPLSMNPQFYDFDYQMRSTIQHAVPTLLATALIFHPQLPQRILPLIAVILLPISVFGAIGLLPYILSKYLETDKGEPHPIRQAALRFFTSIPGYASLALLFLTWLFYSHADGAVTITSVFHVTFGKPLWYIFAKNIFHAGIILLMLFLPILSYRKTQPRLFWVSFVTVALINLIYIGKAGPNEFAFKGQLPSLFVLGSLWADTLARKRWAASAAILALVLFYINYKVTSLSSRFMDFGWKEEHITNPYRGHLYHPGAHINQIIAPRKAPPFHGFTYEKAGESRGIFPFNLLPPEDASLYQRPACFRPQEYFLKWQSNEQDMHILPLFPFLKGN